MTTDVLGAHNFSETPTVNGVPLAVGPHEILQAIPSAIAAQTGTTLIAFANTTPLVTAGTQIWSQTITPSSLTNKINIGGAFMFDTGTAARTLVAALFRGSVCIGVTDMTVTTIARAVPLSFNFSDIPASLTAQTYSIRVGLNAAGTWYVNQTSTAYWNGMLAKNGVLVLEISA
jgi:hypothetical protein